MLYTYTIFYSQIPSELCRHPIVYTLFCSKPTFRAVHQNSLYFSKYLYSLLCKHQINPYPTPFPKKGKEMNLWEKYDANNCNVEFWIKWLKLIIWLHIGKIAPWIWSVIDNCFFLIRFLLFLPILSCNYNNKKKKTMEKWLNAWKSNATD